MKKQVNKTSSSSNLDSSPEEGELSSAYLVDILCFTDQYHYIPLVILISTWRSDSERTFLPIYGKALMERCCKEEAESTKAPAGMKPVRQAGTWDLGPFAAVLMISGGFSLQRLEAGFQFPATD
ncbi:hypothetical protein J1605_018163 [Eschrichtius robustus]|uniref:Uncharacterized protein n=1 Tax=Eschrichtius robustus TaxID=9764 RepID=A0AB34HVD0_ESCRO|nr:hypothetical protein J1605_018163 [Eschrichtius robustus]